MYGSKKGFLGPEGFLKKSIYWRKYQ